MPYEKIGDNEPICIADEVPFEIPESWEWVRLSVVNALFTGNSINETEKRNKYTGLSKGRFYIATKDVSFSHDIDYKNGVRIPFNNEKFRIAPINSILMCIEGGSAGRKIAFTKHDVCFGNKLCCFVSYGINYMYLYYYLQSPIFQAIFKDNKTGIIGGVSVNVLKEIFVPIPPLAEQKRIVEALEKLQPFIDEYDEKEIELSKLNSDFPEQLKKSILQQAIMGKLVPQDENDEPASVLLERIRAEKAALIKAGKLKKDKHESVIYRRGNSHYEKIDGVERCIDDEIPFEIPDSWVWCRISSILSVNPRNSVPDETEVGFIPMPLLEAGFCNSHTFEVRQWKDIKNGFTHFKNGDIVLAKITPCFQNRKSAVIAGLPNGVGAGTTELHVLRDDTSILYMPYFLICFKTQAFIAGGVACFTGTAGQQRVGKEYISNYLIPLPPLAEQKRIVEKVNALMEQCKQLIK